MDITFTELPPPEETPVLVLTLQLTAREAKFLAKILNPTGIGDLDKKAVAEQIHPHIAPYDI